MYTEARTDAEDIKTSASSSDAAAVPSLVVLTPVAKVVGKKNALQTDDQVSDSEKEGEIRRCSPSQQCQATILEGLPRSHCAGEAHQ